MKAKEREHVLQALEARFEQHMERHRGIAWPDVRAKLLDDSRALRSLREMEATGGEPDVIAGSKAGRYTFCDCSAESSSLRRSLCFDGEALEARKEHKPRGSALEMAAAMGLELLTEEQYRQLQELGEFDTKTSPGPWRCALRRSAVRPSVRLPQRRGVVLRRPGFSRFAIRLIRIRQP